MVTRESILKNAYIKLSDLPFSFGIPIYSDMLSPAEIDTYIGHALDDTMREIGIKTLDGIESMSLEEMQIENRIVYYMLKSFRMKSAVFFKFSSSNDGKSIDKTMIPKMLLEIIREYDADFKKWRFNSQSFGIWNRSATNSVNTE